MSYADRIKAKIKEADLEKQLNQLVDEGEKLVTEAVTTAGEIAYDRRGDVQSWLDQASVKVNEKTDGKYTDKVAKVRDTLLRGLDQLAQRRGTDGGDGSADADGTSVDPGELPGPDDDSSQQPPSAG